MNHRDTLSALLFTIIILGAAPSLGIAEEQQPVVSNPQAPAPAFPASRACTKSSPCQNVTGEVIRVEEAYWIRTPTGLETRLKVTDDTKMNSPLKKGDKVAAQVSSTGEAEAVVKMEELPKPPPAASLPSTTAEDIRQQQSGSGR
ncbi:MAG: hypothetical protein H0W13_09485 [Nitrospirales bacterium]|nr:hypothetical protein [Nitrospirales bacterium]